MESFSIQNFGCRVNQAESFEWAGEFQRRGLRFVPDSERGQIVIVNTCTLTGRADRDARKFIRKVLRKNPRARVVVTGCLAERNPGEFEKIPGVWKIIPNGEKKSLSERLFANVRAVGTGEGHPFRSRALLKVQDGCNMTCAFCIIPQVRGRSASVPGRDVLGRIKNLVSQGFREIVLTGIHLCSYGNDLSPRSSLLELLREIENMPGEFKVRLSSLDPRLLPGPLLERLTASNKICPHFHLSLQHGSENILKAMGRMSTISEYRGIMAYLSQRSPAASLGADIIIGFPGETAEDFRATEDFLEESPLVYFHVFSYSPRPGTAASLLKPTEEKTKKERAARLRSLSRRKNLDFRRKFIGEILAGLVIQKAGGGAEILTPNYIDARVAACSAPVGDAVKVKILRVTDEETIGEIA